MESGVQRPTPLSAWMRRVIGACGALLVLESPRTAAQDAASSDQSHPPAAVASPAPLAAPPELGTGPAGDALTPRNLLQLQYELKTAPGTDLNGNPDTVTTETLKLRGDLSVNLSSQWQIVFRGDLPVLAKNPVSDSNPDGGFIGGVGDADIQAALIHQIDSRWKLGAGVRLIAPTGADVFGSGKWQVEPVAGIRYGLPELGRGSYFEPLVRWDASFAGDPNRKAINNLRFAPMVNFALPDGWFFTLYPSTAIRWNFGDPVTGQTGRLFVPFDARIGKAFSDRLSASLEIGVPIVKQYPVYDFMTALRVNLTF